MSQDSWNCPARWTQIVVVRQDIVLSDLSRYSKKQQHKNKDKPKFGQLELPQRLWVRPDGIRVLKLKFQKPVKEVDILRSYLKHFCNQLRH